MSYESGKEKCMKEGEVMVLPVTESDYTRAKQFAYKHDLKTLWLPIKKMNFEGLTTVNGYPFKKGEKSSLKRNFTVSIIIMVKNLLKDLDSECQKQLWSFK